MVSKLKKKERFALRKAQRFQFSWQVVFMASVGLPTGPQLCMGPAWLEALTLVLAKWQTFLRTHRTSGGRGGRGSRLCSPHF